LELLKLLKLYKDKKAEIPFSESVANAVKQFTKKQDITTEAVCDKMIKAGFGHGRIDLIRRFLNAWFAWLRKRPSNSTGFKVASASIVAPKSSLLFDTLTHCLITFSGNEQQNRFHH
jgi:hypothetical protein